jgi:mono/diheme cytochrome c family protein
MPLRNSLLLACLCLITACFPATPIKPGDANAGRILFEQGTLDIQPCAACHSIDGNNDLLGPTLKGIATTAATRISGQNTDDYLITSMKTPNAFLVSGYDTDLMPALKATDEQYGDLLAYMLTLK